MTTRKPRPRKPTKKQFKIASMFKDGKSVPELAWIFGEKVRDKRFGTMTLANSEKIENDLRTVLLWEQANAEE